MLEKASVRRQASVVQCLQDAGRPGTADPAAGLWSGQDTTLRISGVTPARATSGENAASARKREKAKA